MIVDLNVSIPGMDPSALAASAKKVGLDGLVLSDPDNLDPDLQAFREAAADQDLKVFRGAQVRTNHGIILCILPAEKRLEPDFAERDGEVYDVDAVVDAVEGLEGVTVALRPYDRDVAEPMGDHLFSLQGLVACEVLNGRLPEIANDLALEAATNLEMPCVGGSGAAGVDALGTAATLLKGEVEDETALCDALRDGACWPLGFRDKAPAVPKSSSDGKRSGKRRSGRKDGGDRGGDRGGQGDRRRGRRRGGGGRRGGGDDVGNVASRGRRLEDLPEDIGNRVRPGQGDDAVDENIGNRLRPGEASPFRPAAEEVPEFTDDEDDNFGNR